jgi:hypothetical protein
MRTYLIVHVYAVLIFICISIFLRVSLGRAPVADPFESGDPYIEWEELNNERELEVDDEEDESYCAYCLSRSCVGNCNEINLEKAGN